eukprot:m.123951 g.123951  ORF g.123951 m.123951 type:complete len:126 (-) comp14459_c1_seq15:571-948(-)
MSCRMVLVLKMMFLKPEGGTATDNAVACAYMCDNNIKCHFYTYTSWGFCYLKSEGAGQNLVEASWGTTGKCSKEYSTMQKTTTPDYTTKEVTSEVLTSVAATTEEPTTAIQSTGCSVQQGYDYSG